MALPIEGPLAGLSAIVTGAGRGLGRASSRASARLGASVVVDDHGGAEPGEFQRLGPAEPAARARDDGGQPLKWQ